MKFILVSAIILFNFAGFSQNLYPDTTIYIKGNGLNNTHFYFYPNGNVEAEYWCDICPTELIFGCYWISNDSIFMDFEMEVVYDPNSNHPQDSIITFENWSDTLYSFSWKESEYLISTNSRIHQEIILFEQTNDPRMLSIITQKYLRKRVKKKV